MQRALAGFWSYVIADDSHERGRIARLRDRLQQSVHFHTGFSFEIFLDKNKIGWGQRWEERIRDSLNDALLLFPIITPSYFSSKSCRDEFLAFEERQRRLGRDDLILPIYYLSADPLEGGLERLDDSQAAIGRYLLAHQYEDFRSFRTSDEADRSYVQAVERLGLRVAEALRRGHVALPAEAADVPNASNGRAAVANPSAIGLPGMESGGGGPSVLSAPQRVQIDRAPHRDQTPQEKNIVRTRGIFHPALLAILQKCIVIEFFVARSIRSVQEAFDNARIKYVTANQVRGVEDILIRRYIESSLVHAGEVPSISRPYDVPYVKLRPEEFAAAFDIHPQAPYLRILIKPEQIKKFRGVAVKELDSNAWVKLCGELSEMIHPNRDLGEIIKLASELPEGGTIPEKFKSVFSLGIEKVVPIGRESGIRETYLFLSCENQDGNPATTRFKSFARERLAEDDRVRDICEFNLIDVNPPVRHMPFQFLMRLKCNVFDGDDLLGLIQEWAKNSGVRVGTRSYDAWRNIIREGISGIVESSVSKEDVDLQKALCAIDPDFVFESREIQGEFARRIADHQHELNKVHSADWHELRELLSQFFYFVCLFNCVKSSSKQRTYKNNCGDRWNSLYRYLESYCGKLLGRALKLPPNARRPEIAEGLKEKDPEYFKRRGTDGGFVRWFADFYGSLVPDKAGLAKLVDKSYAEVSAFRNLAVHGQVADDLDLSIKVSGSQWRQDFRILNSRVETMRELIVSLSAELQAVFAE
jgi:hypothetical protein